MLPESVLREIAAPLESGGRSLPCGHLYKYIAQTAVVPTKLSVGSSNALLLAALSVRFAKCVLEDLQIDSVVQPSARRWKGDTEIAAVKVSALSLTWESAASDIRVLAKTVEFLESVPRALVHSVLAWAPPVVTSPNRTGSRRVVANHVSAAMARYICYAEHIKVRQLVSRVSIRRSLTEISMATVTGMGSMVDRHEIRIANIAESLKQAQLLTGKSRAWCAEKRRRK